LEAELFYEGDKKPPQIGLEPPEYTITVQIEGKDPVVFHVGKEEESKRYVRVPGQETIFQVPTWRLREYLKDPKEFLTSAAKKELEDKEKAEKEKAEKEKAEKEKAEKEKAETENPQQQTQTSTEGEKKPEDQPGQDGKTDAGKDGG
jgi:hypothetical protein